MPLGYAIVVTVHVLAAIVWIGGLLFLGLVGAPVVRTLDPAVRRSVFDAIGRRFRGVGWSAVAILVATGVANLHYRGLLHWEGVFGSPAFWRSALGIALAVKLAAVVGLVGVSAVHDFVLGPRSSGVTHPPRDAERYRQLAAATGRWSAILALVLVAAAVRVSRGG